MTDLAPFVPRLALELGSVPGSTWSSIDGSMLSADISGFTALSERLAGKGKAGAEEITALINTCFTALIDAAYAHGGEVIKFGGDAILVLFRGEGHQLRVSHAAIAMQVALHASPAAKRADLTMTVGAAEGPFDTFVVGSAYRELLIVGRAASEVIRLEGEAAKGETLVSPSLAAHLPAGLLGRTHSGGVAVAGEDPEASVGPEIRQVHSGDLSPFVPAEVGEQWEAFAELGGEHRIATVGFVLVTGVAALIDHGGPAQAAAVLGRLTDDILAATQPYGVTVLHSDIADDGLKFVLCAGAPVNPGDTSDAMLQAALEIAAIDSPLVLRQGIQTGRVFAGFLGSEYRRTYTLMGDPVNTAARMLGKAGDRDVVAVATVVDDTRTVFVSEPLEPFTVKGKAEPILAHRVMGVTDQVRRGWAATPLIGRRRELDILTSAIGELGQVVEVVGAAGSGKSRLLDAAWDAAEGLTIFQGACTPYGVTSPYSLFRPLLRIGTGIDVQADAEEAGKLLTKVVYELAPDLLPWLPLIAVPFGATVSATPEADAIDPEFRRARIHASVVDFLDAALSGPVFLVAEDLHWVDEASAELVDHLIRASSSRPWAAVFTRRPEGPWALDDSGYGRTLTLEPLTEGEVRDLVIEVSTRPLNDSEVDAVVDRSGGNPLFAIELARALSDSEQAELPDTVEALLSRRIDRLDPSTRRLVRLASAFGQEFDRDDLGAVVEQMAPGLEVDLGRVRSIFERRRGSRVAFTHALFRDVAYEGLPFNQRRTLHRAIGEHLEAAAVSPDDMAALLSLHFAAAGDRQRTWRYGVQAGELASRQEAPAEAAVLYRRALDHRPRSVESRELAEVFARLGEANLASGNFDAAFDAFTRARRNASARRDTLRYSVRQGLTRDRQGRYRSALALMSRAVTGCEAGDADIEAQARLGRASVFHRTARHRQCWREANEALALSRRAAEPATQAHALHLLHASGSVLGEPAAAGHGSSALALYEEVGNAAGAAEVLNNLGVDAYYDARWLEAEALYRRSLDRKVASGDLVGSALVRMNLAELQIERGDPADAAELLADALRNFESAGFAIGVAYVQTLRGRLAALEGDHDTGEAELRRGIDGFRTLGAAGHASDAELRLAEVLIAGGGLPQARKVIDLVAHELETGREQFDSPDRAAAQLALLESALRVREGEDAPRELWQQARTHAVAAGADELVAACDVLLLEPSRAEPAVNELRSRGIRRMPLLEVTGGPPTLDLR